MLLAAVPRNSARAWTVAGANYVTVAVTQTRPVTVAPPAERLTVGHDADRLTRDVSLMALSLPARLGVAARNDASPTMSAASTACSTACSAAGAQTCPLACTRAFALLREGAPSAGDLDLLHPLSKSRWSLQSIKVGDLRTLRAVAQTRAHLFVIIQSQYRLTLSW